VTIIYLFANRKGREIARKRRKDLESLKPGDKIEISDCRYLKEAIYKDQSKKIITATVWTKLDKNIIIKKTLPKSAFLNKVINE
jgi:preprotein translocase subunit YajC